MVQGYNSYLLRYWRMKNGTRRIAVEHVQSGERAVAVSLRAATAWIGEHSGTSSPPEAEEGTVSEARQAAGDAARPAR